MRVKAFTLLEIMIVVVILGVLSGLALPQFLRTVEIQRAGNAIGNMRLIVGGVRMLVSGRALQDCNPCDIAWINSSLGLEIRDTNFDYSLTSSSADRTWSVTADRVNAPKGDYTLRMSHGAPDEVSCEPVEDGCAFIRM